MADQEQARTDDASDATDQTSRDEQPTREKIDQSEGPVVLEFGSLSCGHCQAFRPILDQLLVEFPQVQHIKIEDQKGAALGRSFQVKLWPTLIFLRDGELLHREARPDRHAARIGLAAITSQE